MSPDASAARPDPRADGAAVPIPSLTDATLYDDPWDAYAHLREAGVWFDERSGLWGVARHADVVEASRDSEHFSAAQGVRPVSLVPLSIVSMDDPDHARQRRLLSKGFTPRQVRTLTEHVRELTNEVIDEVQERGEIDFVSDLARHVPLIVISELLGLDPSLRDTLYTWSDELIGGEGHEDPTHPAIERAALAFGAYTTLVSEVIEERRIEPRDDLLSILTQAYDEGALAYSSEVAGQYDAGGADELTNDELLMFCVLLMVAGNETTRNAIAGGLPAFTLFPEERAKLAVDPSLIDSAVEEILRWTSPVLNFVRTVTSPVTLGGVDLVAGDRVLLLYQAANRDERVFDEPDRFRIDRDPNPHLAFGFGPHFCMGANLARMEIKVVFEELFRRLPDIEVTEPHRPPDRSPSAFVAGIHHLPARFTPVGGAGVTDA